MQGKKRYNSEIDAVFQDTAWSEMSALLDKEMPAAPTAPAPKHRKRKYLVFAALLCIGFASGVGTMLLVDASQPETPPQSPEPSYEKQEIADGAIVNTAKVPIADSDQLINQQLLNEAVENDIHATLQTNHKNSSHKKKTFTNSSSVNSDLFSTLAPVFSASILDRPEEPTGLPNQITQSTDSKILAPQVADAQQETAKTISPAILSLPTLLAEGIEKPMPDEVDLSYLSVEAARKWNFGIYVSRHSRDFTATHGWTAGLTSSFQLDPAFAIRTGITYSQLTGFRSTSFGANEPLTHTYFEPLEQSSIDYSTVSSLEGNQDLPFQSLRYIDVPLALHYKMSGRIGVLMGLRMSYLLDTQMDSYVSRALDDDGKRLLDEALYNSMRKIDVATVLGLCVYPTAKIGLELRYNHGLIDYTKDQLWHIRQLNTNKTFELGLHYSLR